MRLLVAIFALALAKAAATPIPPCDPCEGCPGPCVINCQGDPMENRSQFEGL